MATTWKFEADYYTNCNCDWGCPCNFNARPTQGTCHGVGTYRIRKGRFGDTRLDGAIFATAYFFPGPIERGNAIRRLYIDRKTTTAQRKAIEAIGGGEYGGGIFEIFQKLVSKSYPTRIVDIDFRIEGPKVYLRIGDLSESQSEALSYPDGSTILPKFVLPHGIEFKEALATNTKRWWIRDEELLASHENVYGAVSTVTYTNEGCVA
ncbi:MAG TPA: DUF1326 domain-containing protein [Thermoplasmata archaeon]|nr:DUF1326 domain-containing protein [Thermoplasmata archaeon]